MKPRPPVTTHDGGGEVADSGRISAMFEITRRAKIGDMDEDEYQRMVVAGEHHWWYRSTRALLGDAGHAPPAAVDGDTLYLDAAGGPGRPVVAGGPGDDGARRVRAVALQAAVHDHAGYRAVRADINHAAARPSHFDAVLCVTALYHRMIPDPQAVVDEFARVTKPGGVVCLMEPGGKRLWRGHDDVTHAARRFSLAEMRTMVRGAGLDLVRATGAYTFLVPPAALMAVMERGKNKSDVGRNEGGLGGALGQVARAERALLKQGRPALRFVGDRDRPEAGLTALRSRTRSVTITRCNLSARRCVGEPCSARRPLLQWQPSRWLQSTCGCGGRRGSNRGHGEAMPTST